MKVDTEFLDNLDGVYRLLIHYKSGSGLHLFDTNMGLQRRLKWYLKKRHGYSICLGTLERAEIRVRLVIVSLGDIYPTVVEGNIDVESQPLSLKTSEENLRFIMSVYQNTKQDGNGTAFVCRDPGTRRLTENLGTLLESGDGADVTLVVGKEEIAAHRLILSARSPVFKKTLEADMAEKRTGRITVGECDVDTMKAVLRYIYTGSCPGLEVEETAIKMLDLSERYQLEDLKALVAHHLSKLLTSQNAVRILLLAERYKVRDLLQTTIEHIIFFKEEVKDTAEWKDNANHPILVTCDLVRSLVGVPP